VVGGLAVDEGNARASTRSMDRSKPLAQHEQYEDHESSKQESRRWSERAQCASHHLGKVNVGEG